MQGAEAQLGLVDSQMGVLWGLGYTHFLKVLPTPTVFHSFLVSENIYSKTGIEKTVQSLSAAENSAPAQRHSPSCSAVPPLWVALCQAQPVHSSQKGMSGSSKNLQGGGERSMAPSHPPALLPVPHRGVVGWEALRDGEYTSDPPQSGGTKDAPCIQAQSYRGWNPLSWGCCSSQNPGPETTPALRAGTPTDLSRVGGCIHASGH